MQDAITLWLVQLKIWVFKTFVKLKETMIIVLANLVALKFLDLLMTQTIFFKVWKFLIFQSFMYYCRITLFWPQNHFKNTIAHSYQVLLSSLMQVILRFARCVSKFTWIFKTQKSSFAFMILTTKKIEDFPPLSKWFGS